MHSKMVFAFDLLHFSWQLSEIGFVEIGWFEDEEEKKRQQNEPKMMWECWKIIRR